MVSKIDKFISISSEILIDRVMQKLINHEEKLTEPSDIDTGVR